MRNFILWIGGLVIAAMCLFPPHQVEKYDALENQTIDEIVYRPVWAESNWRGTLSIYRDATIHVERLMLQILVVLVAMGVAYLLTENRQPTPPVTSSDQ